MMQKFFLLLLLSAAAAVNTAAAILENFSGTKPQLYLDNGAKRNQQFTVTNAPGTNTPAGKISWTAKPTHFAEAIFLNQNIMPEFSDATVTVKIYTPENCPVTAFNLCLIDAHREVFQWNQKVDWKQAGWKTLTYKITPTNFNLTWESGKDRKFAHPAKLFGFKIDFQKNAGAGELWIGEISFVTAGGERVVVSSPFITFDRREKWDYTFDSGNGNVVSSFAGLSINAKASACTLTSRMKNLLPRPKPAAVVLNAKLLSGEASVQFVFRGSNGKTAESAPCRILQGDNQIEIGLARPLSALPGPVTLAEIRLASTSRNFALLLNNATIIYHLAVIEAINVEVLPASPLHLLYTGTTRELHFQFTNQAAVQSSFRADVILTAPDGRTIPLQQNFMVEANSTQAWVPNWSPDQLGLWQITYTLTDLNTPDSRQRGRLSFAYLNAPPTNQPPASSRFSIGDLSGMFSSSEQELEIMAAEACDAKLLAQPPPQAIQPQPDEAGDDNRVQAENLFKNAIMAWAASKPFHWPALRNTGFRVREPGQNNGLMTVDFYPKDALSAAAALTGIFRGLDFRRNLLSAPAQITVFGNAERLALPAWQPRNNAPNSFLIKTDAKQAARVDLFGNTSAMPLNNGIVLFEVAPEPATLVLAGAKSAECLGRPLEPDTGNAVFSGQEFRRQLTLRNPLAIPVEYTLSTQVPDGFTAVNVPAVVNVAPGAVANLNAVFKVNPKRKGIYGDTPVIKIGYNIKPASWQGTLCIPLEIAVSIPGGSDFNRPPDFVLNQSSQAVSLLPGQPWNGPNDLSAMIWLGLTGKELLLRVDVTDDTHRQGFSGNDVARGDSIMLMLQDQTSQWQISLSRLDNGKPDIHTWKAPAGLEPAQVTAKIRLDVARQAQHTIYTAAIPLNAINLSAEQLRRGIRFNLQINDNDGDGRKSMLKLIPAVDSQNAAGPTIVFE